MLRSRSLKRKHVTDDLLVSSYMKYLMVLWWLDLELYQCEALALKKIINSIGYRSKVKSPKKICICVGIHADYKCTKFG